MDQPAIVKNADAQVLNEKSIIPFGKKHKGKKVSQVIKEDPNWIIWVEENFTNTRFTPEVLVKCQDRTIAPVSFSFSQDELKAHIKLIGDLEQGLDPYGDRGIRQVHGFGDKDDLHKTLSYFRRMGEFISDQFIDRDSIQINKT